MSRKFMQLFWYSWISVQGRQYCSRGRERSCFYTWIAKVYDILKAKNALVMCVVCVCVWFVCVCVWCVWFVCVCVCVWCVLCVCVCVWYACYVCVVCVVCVCVVYVLCVRVVVCGVCVLCVCVCGVCCVCVFCVCVWLCVCVCVWSVSHSTTVALIFLLISPSKFSGHYIETYSDGLLPDPQVKHPSFFITFSSLLSPSLKT